MRMFLLSFTVFFSFSAFALPKVTVENINGFEVHFVDIKAGNSFAVSFQVPYGTLHDTGRFMGRAHLLEHLLHVGTTRYPGYHTFDHLLAPAGVNTNAMTSWDRTFYYAAGLQEQAELIMQVFLSMLGGLEWDPETIEKERNVVIHEIVEEGIPQEVEALMQMPFTQLLPDGHPWKHSLLGDFKSLKGLTIEDLKALYHQVYRPGNVKVVIQGNFSDPKQLDQVRSWTHQYLKPAPEATALPIEHFIPPLTSADGGMPQAIQMNSQNLRYGAVYLEADTSALPENPAAVNGLIEYLSSNIPGSFLHKLTSTQGLLTEGSFTSAIVGNKLVLGFVYALTEKGKGQSEEVQMSLFRAFRDIQEGNVDQEYLRLAKQRKLKLLEMSGLSVDSFLMTYGNILRTSQDLDQRVRDLQSLSSEDLRQVAKSLDPARALYSDLAPEHQGAQTDATYKRRFAVNNYTSQINKFTAINQSPAPGEHLPRLTPVDLGQLQNENQQYFFLQSRPEATIPHRYTFDLRRDLPDISLALELKLDVHSPEDMLALEMVEMAFSERFSSHLTYIAFKYSISMSSTGNENSYAPNTYTFSASGEDQYVPRALAWKMEQLKNFTPTKAELARAREQLTEAYKSNYADSFSAQIGITTTKSLVNPLLTGGMEAYNLALNLSDAKINAIWQRLKSRANRNLVAVGNVSIGELQAVDQAAASLFPLPLEPMNQQRMRERIQWDGQTHEHNMQFAVPKGVDPVAITRFYRGPFANDFKASAAFLALNMLLSEEISSYNRGEQQLGYIHTSTTKLLDSEHRFLGLLGGTEGSENADKMMAGWNLILTRLQNGEINDAKIGDAISGLINALSSENTTASDWADKYSASLGLYHDPRASEQTLAAARTLTPDDVRESARRYIMADGTPYTQLTLHGCEDLLTP